MRDVLSTADGFFVEPTEQSHFNSDSMSLHETNLKDNSDQMKEFGWISIDKDNPRVTVGEQYLYNPENPMMNDWVNLSYQLNSHGFRGEEMPTVKKPRSIITLGCSNTFGVGMPVGQIWPTLVGNTLRFRAYNLGVPLGSLDTAFRLLINWLPKINPSHVFMLEPPGIRYETITSHGIKKSSIHVPQPNVARFDHEEDWILHREKTMRAIQSLCDQFETPFTSLTDEIFEVDMDIGKQDYARDLMHPGRKSHVWVAMNMLKEAGYEWDIEKK